MNNIHTSPDSETNSRARNKLTPRQREAVTWIVAFVARHRYAPSLREIGAGLGIRSSNAVSDLLLALEKKGAIRRTPRKARALEVL